MSSKWSPARKDHEVPLLEDKMPYPDCPGCRCAHLSAPGSGPPVKQLIMVSSVVLCNAIPISSLFSFLYFMVSDFHIAKKSENIGFYAGAIVSIFMVGRVLSSVLWGMFADKYGRKPVFYLGLLSIVILQPVFGSSQSYWVAFAARFLLGVFNGMLGPLKAYASEICSPESQAWGLNVVGTTWSLGMIVGPALGGFLAMPAVNYPGIVSEDSIFASYPYLLPSLVQAGLAVIELAVVYHLPETVHRHGEERSSDIEEPLVKSEKAEIPSLWRNWALMASVAFYSVWSLHEIAFGEIFSMWCVSPKETGGLSLKSSDVGTILAISGVGMLCVQLALFPPLAKYLGAIKVSRLPTAIVILLVALFPFVPYLHGQEQWLSINALALLRNSFSTMSMTASFLLVNNAVSSEHRGAANGISLSCTSGFRAFAPAAGGALFSWSQSRPNASILPGSQLIFAILDLTCVAAFFMTFPPFLPKHLDHPYSELRAQETEHAKSNKNTPVLK